MNFTDVFISYQRDDKEFAVKLQSKLETKGHKVWMDKNIPYGAKWRAAIDKQLENTALLVLIASPASMTSAYVTYEWSYAVLSLDKDFHWIQIADCDKDKGMYGLLMDSRNAPLVVSGKILADGEWNDVIASIEVRLKDLNRIREAGEILIDENRGHLAPDAAEYLGKVNDPFHVPLARKFLLKGLKTHTYTSGKASRPIIKALSNVADLSAIPYLINFRKETHETDIDATADALINKLVGQNS